MFIYVVLLSIGFIGIAFIGFALNILFKKNGHFPETSVGKNKALRAKNVYCIKTEQKLIDKQIKAGDNTICSSC
ncbi:MAG: hypothetical protein P1P88_08490 [Bacteroidales bacterium]|nr:hypothetical protein [Bacteroidales bacterium]